jgi:hypothetical protein
MTASLLERNSGKFSADTAPRVPAQARIFAPQYAYSGALADLVKASETIRDQTTPSGAYDALWVAFCMEIDFKHQRPLLVQLRRALPSPIKKPDQPDHQPTPISPEIRKAEVETYWHNLRARSVYPFFIATRDKLRHSGYAAKVVEGWKSPKAVNEPPTRWHDSFNEAAKIFPNIHIRYFRRTGYGFIGSVDDNSSSPHFKNLQDQLRDKDKPKLMGYTTLLAILNMARRAPQDRLGQQIASLERANSGKIKLEFSAWEERIERLLLELEPYYHLQQLLSESLDEWERANFGDNAELAGTLWRNAVHLRYSELPKSTNALRLRKPLVESLIDEDFEGARDRVEGLMANYPGILPKFVAERLQIEPEVLRAIILEEHSLSQAKIENSLAEPYISPEKKAYDAALKATETLLNRDMVSKDGKLTLRITRRTITTHTPDGSPYTRARFDVHTNNLLGLLGRTQNPIITPHALPGLIEQFGFTFIDSGEAES